MKTLAEQYKGRRKTIENYCRDGMTVKQMAVKLDVTPNKIANIIKALEISLIRLRNYGYTNVNFF